MGGLPPERGMGPVIVIEVLPFPQLFVEQARFIDHDALEHPIELLIVHPVAPFDFPVCRGLYGLI